MYAGQKYKRIVHIRTAGGSLCGVAATVLNWDIVINEFELQSKNYVHF